MDKRGDRGEERSPRRDRNEYRPRKGSPDGKKSLTASSDGHDRRDYPERSRRGDYSGRSERSERSGRGDYHKGSEQRNDQYSRDQHYNGRPRRHKSRSPSPGRITLPQPAVDLASINPDDEEAIMRAMGFGGFDSTKGKHVVGNVTGAADKKKKVEYRQMLHKKRLYEIPLTRQQAEEQEHQRQQTNSN